jgi:hypothetical protein
MLKRKVWLALGTAALVAAPLLNGPWSPSAARPRGHPNLVAQAGEGGERSHRNGGPAAEDSDLSMNLRSLRDLHVTRGHLLVGDELIREGEVNRAEMCSNARVRRRKTPAARFRMLRQCGCASATRPCNAASVKMA